MGRRFLLLMLVAGTGLLAQHPADEPDYFEETIRPLLASRCYACHAEAATSGLRLDSREALLKGGSRGPAVSPGYPAESLLFQAVSGQHKLLRMPPNGNLPAEEVAHLEAWIARGAEWPLSPQEFFASKIQPIFEQKCVACHGESALGGLRLDSREALAKGGAHGPAVVAGDAHGSLLIRSVRYGDDALRMPPAGKLSDTEISYLEKWVAEGAVWPSNAVSSGFTISGEQRAHWAFQPVSEPAPPVAGLAVNPIDAFVRRRLAEKGLSPSPRADRLTLLRRVTYDLTGLPPTPAEIEAFAADEAPGAYYRLVERLLASPRYGERWGRHWMDVVRYSDTAGDSADYPVPQAVLYRDYIIESFNADKPYDEFVREQIAGDLLPASDADDRWENTVATGYVAMARRFNVTPEAVMNLTYEDAIDNVGKAFLGLSVSCARCHDHKFDPIAQADYYALYGIFDSTAWPFAGSENRWGQYGLVPRDAEAMKEWVAPVSEEWAELDGELSRLVAAQNHFYEKFYLTDDEDERARLREERGSIGGRIKELVKDRRELLGKLPPPPEMAWAVAEGDPHDVPIHLRGERDKLGETVPRGFLQILGGQTLENPEQSGRLELANWITDPANPLTARVMVNRVWQFHFGRGLVATPNDFGARGQAPSHPELLDYLTAWFVEHGWSVKALHRLILLSETYRQASGPNAAADGIDPENKLLWRYNRWRLDAEALRDSLLSVGGELDLTMGGEQPFPEQGEWNYSQHRPFHAVYESNRRSVYLMTQRIQKHPFLSMFDGADANATTPERGLTTNPIQALFLMNSELIHESSQGLAQRLAASGAALPEQVAQAHELVLGRDASAADVERAREYVAKAQLALGRAGIPEEQHRQEALASYVRALLASNGFLFVD